MNPTVILASTALLIAMTMGGCTDQSGQNQSASPQQPAQPVQPPVQPPTPHQPDGGQGDVKSAVTTGDVNRVCATAQGSLNGAVKVSERALSNSLVKKVYTVSVEGVEEAYNSSIVKIPNQDRFLYSFRFDCKTRTNTKEQTFTGLFELDDKLKPVSNAAELPERRFVVKSQGTEPSAAPTTRVSSQGQDPRLFATRGKLFALINDTPDGFSFGFEDRRMYLGELSKADGKWSFINPLLLTAPETVGKDVPEKNWVPFSYSGAPSDMLFGYWVHPMVIKKLGQIVKDGESLIEPFSKCANEQSIAWKLGNLRGGTPAIHISGGRYLSFFHSPEKLDGATTYHMGAYIFEAASGCITDISAKPISFEGIYDAPRGPYVKALGGDVIFPCGLERFTDSDGKAALLVSAGVNDTRSIIMVLDYEKLLRSLVKVSSKT